MIKAKVKVKKPKKVKTETPKYRIKNVLRQLWLRSIERATRLKFDGYSCVECGIKQSKAKGKEVSVCVHHLDGIDWDMIQDLIYERILVKPDKLVTLCKACHDAIHHKT